MIEGQIEKLSSTPKMKDKKLIDKLKLGVDGWNQWRQNNPEVKIDLSGKNLSKVNLKGANLNQANLIKVDFQGANLDQANLREANLAGAILIETSLCEADLSYACLYMVNLSKADLSKAKLRGANIIEADLRSASCIEAQFQSAFLICADLTRADLEGADLSGASLTKAILNRTKFVGANLTGANLSRIEALGTNFDSATFTGVCIEDWDWYHNSDTNLDNVICEYIYLKGSEQERCPSNGKFALGEFTKRIQKNLIPFQKLQKKILVLTAIPHGLRLDKEIREIEEAIRRAANRNLFEICIKTAVRSQDIRRAIEEQKPQIVHFCGHGEKDGSLLLEDDGGNNKPVTPIGLASLFKLHSDYVECVLLNACYSGKSAVKISKYINYVIGMNNSIQDITAIEFTKGFYDGLGYEISVNQDVFQRAFDEGQVAIQMGDQKAGKIPVLKKKG